MTARAVPAGPRAAPDGSGAAQPRYQTGKPGYVEIVIVPKPGFKINEQYPTKFTADPAPKGVAIPGKTLRTGDGTFSAKRGVLRLKVIPSKAGSATIGGSASFSVCNETSCIVGKQHLDVQLRVQ